MKKIKLEKEIEEASDRIKSRQNEIETEIFRLSQLITRFTKWAWAFVWIGAIISVLSIIYFICTNTEQGFGLNLLGDFMAGTVASVWSLAGLFFIYVAFLGQKQQLLNQQLEIMYSQLEVKYTRLELSGQKAEMAEQNNTLRRQRFENTFFQLLNNHQEIVNGIDIRKSNTQVIIHQGRDCFKSFYNDFRKQARTQLSLEHSTIKYEVFYESHQSDLGHYFRNLYHILKFIKESPELGKDEGWKYSSLLRALLSSYELVFLFYNGLSKEGNKKLKPHIEYFSMLKNLDKNLLVMPNHSEGYKEIAFASSEERESILKKRK